MGCKRTSLQLRRKLFQTNLRELLISVKCREDECEVREELEIFEAELTRRDALFLNSSYFNDQSLD